MDYADADQAVSIWDQLNTHTPVSLYKAFPPAEAWRYIPKHGSWFKHRQS